MHAILAGKIAGWPAQWQGMVHGTACIRSCSRGGHMGQRWLGGIWVIIISRSLHHRSQKGSCCHECMCTVFTHLVPAVLVSPGQVPPTAAVAGCCHSWKSLAPGS
jgi:hypothetical protein